MTTIVRKLARARYWGLDADGYLTTTGALGIKVPSLALGTGGAEVAFGPETGAAVTVGSSSSTGAHPFVGISRLDSTASSTFVLNAPTAAGQRKLIVATKTSTGAALALAAGNILSSTGGSTFTRITVTAAGACVELASLSTALSFVVGTESTGFALS